MQSLLDHPLVGHLLTVGGFVLALFAIARIISEKRQPSNTLAWLLAIILIPYVGVPLYLVLGGRKLRDAPWPSGTWRGRYSVIRDGEEIAFREVELEMPQ